LPDLGVVEDANIVQHRANCHNGTGRVAGGTIEP